MTQLKRAPTFKSERRKTDESLSAEREKTTESLAKAKASAEVRTDSQVDSDRRQTDQVKSDLREVADQKAAEESKDSQNPSNLSNKGNQQNKDRLTAERDRSDRAIETERSQVDRAIENERKQKDAMASRLLEQERKRTDQNLSAERSRTDAEVDRTTELLSEEISQHSRTKTSLTTRDEFLAIVSHDLKNPIGAASLCAEMLLTDPTFQGFSSEARTMIELIKRNVDISLRLIADLLDMERIEGGRLQLNLSEVDPVEVIEEVIAGIAPVASGKKLDLRLLLPDVSFSDRMQRFVCDRDRLTQILSNLIGNAVKFTPIGGAILVSPVFELEGLKISVRDTGPGIPSEKVLHIFDRYAQLGVNDRVGLGLGLYISKLLVELHRGRIWVASEFGRGSTFSFTLPSEVHA